MAKGPNPEPDVPTSDSASGLRRVLGLPQLVIYGLVMIQPTAPMPLFGVAHDKSHGHVVTVILIGMVAMLFTALSYGRMANAYPAAGSAYTYVGRELHPGLGYLTGWSMLFDYVMNPLICVIWCSKAAMNLLPGSPFGVWAALFVVFFTGMNLRGIQSSARTNSILASLLCLVILLFFAAALRYLAGHPPSGVSAYTRPFYDPATFNWSALSSGAALGVLTYIGFDGISTLSEEVKDPRRNVLRATVLVCLITGALAAAQVYVAQLVWPEPASTFPDKDTAFVHVAGRAGGPWLFHTLNLALLLATVGSGMGAHLSAGRLLYGMGRDDAIPKKFFGALHPRTQVPANNILLVGGVVAVTVPWMDYDLGAQLLNFGALVGFMGVNLAAFVHYYVRGRQRRWTHLWPPVLGFLVCGYLWTSLSWKARLIGFCWLALGGLYGAWRTRGFRRPLRMFAE